MLVQLSKWRDCKATDAEKLLSQCERKLLNAILREKLKSRKMVFLMKWIICNAEDRFSCVRAFLQSKSWVRASKNTNAVLVQLSKWRDCKATDAEKLLSQWEKVA